MPAHLRFQSQNWAIHHVVSRCIQGFAFLKPTKEIRSITKGVFGFALNKYVEVIQLHHGLSEGRFHRLSFGLHLGSGPR